MYRTLFVDDEFLVRESITKIVDWEQNGFELAGVCENGQEAICYLESHKADLVITDIDMPYLDGLELSRYLHEHFPETIIVILSGYDDFDYAKQAIEYEVSEYILKPITSEEFGAVLKKVRKKLDKRQAENIRINRLAEGYHRYTRNESLILSKYLSRLVMGTQDLDDLKEELQEFEIDLKGKGFRIVVVSIDIFSEWHDKNTERIKESALISYTIENISNEIIGKYGAGMAFKDSDERICILGRTDHPQVFRNQIRDIVREIQECVMETLNLTVSASIGEYVYTLEQLPLSYKSAMNTLDYCYIKGDGCLLDGERIVEEANYEGFEEELKVFTAALKQYDDDEVKACIERVGRHICGVYVKREKARAYLILLLRTLYETLTDMNVEIEWKEEILDRISGASNFALAMKLVDYYVDKALACRESQNKSSSQKQAILATNYIRDHYSDPDLTLNMLCEYLNISVSYFSFFFKKETGKTFKEMLIQIRMDKARQLLKQTDLRNYEIAEKIGFKDAHYFTILFKKITGFTPKEYARKHGRSGLI